MKRIFFIPLLIFSFLLSTAQSLRPGFDSKEYGDILPLIFQQYDSSVSATGIPLPSNYHVNFRSPELALKNKWVMWYRNDNQLGIISLRGTINAAESWLENFYAAMVPATGTLQLNDSTSFIYKLAADNKATVHVGWLLAIAYMAPSIIEQVKIAHEKGIKEFIIAGHSQGGALAFLTTSYLLYQQQAGALPAGIHFKTYCSAGPKPGNMYYAYDFDFITRNGWAFNVVNAADWVPESAFSIQCLTDFNPVNAIANIPVILKKQHFLVRYFVKARYNKMNRKTRKAQKYFEKNLGHLAYKIVKKTLPQFKEPAYAHTNNYQRAGVPIVLEPDEVYYKLFPNDTSQPFIHHMYKAYAYLIKSIYP